MMDFATARTNMIESQIRPNGVTDARVLAAIATVPREVFVPEELRAIAYMDEDVRIANAEGAPRHLMEPMAFARLLDLADISAGDIVLDIGCGSGYSSAVLAELAESVVAVEADEALAQSASDNLSALEIANAVVLNKPHAAGCKDEAPFDVIVINGRIPDVPQALLEQLKDGGRLVAARGEGPIASNEVWTRHGDRFANSSKGQATVSALPGFEREPAGFEF